MVNVKKKFLLLYFLMAFVLFTGFSRAVMTIDGDLKGVSIPKESATGILIANNYKSDGGRLSCLHQSATLLSSDWIVTACFQNGVDHYKEFGATVSFRDQFGNIHLSEVDGWLCYDRFEINGFMIVFGHLKTPIDYITPVKLKEVYYKELYNQVATLVGHDWRTGNYSLKHTEYLPPHDHFITDPSSIFDAPKAAVRVRLEDLNDTWIRMNALSLVKLIDEGKDDDEKSSLEEEELILPGDSKFKSKEERLKLLYRLPDGIYGNFACLAESAGKPLLSSALNYPGCAGKKIFDVQKLPAITCPEYIPGEGFAELYDIGAGIYFEEKDGSHALAGMVLGTPLDDFERISIGGVRHMAASIIVPSHVIQAAFDELCPQKSSKQKKKRKSNKSRKRNQKNSVPLASNVPEAEEKEKGKEKEGESYSDYAGASEALTPGWNLNRIKEFLANFIWAGLVVKTQETRDPYKELYVFRLCSNRHCIQSVSLLKQGAILDDHIANGDWKVDECAGGFRLKVMVYPKIYNLSQELKKVGYSFDIIPDEEQLRIIERKCSKDLQSYKNRNDTKRRTKIGLYRVGSDQQKGLNPLCGLSSSELFEPITCRFSPQISFNGKAYKHFGVDMRSLKDLMGEWKIVGMADFPKKPKEILPFSGAHRVIVGEEYVSVDGNEYLPELKYHYELNDLCHQRRGTCLHLVPRNAFLRPITLGIYSNGQNLLLATQRVSSNNSVTKETRTLYQSLFYAR